MTTIRPLSLHDSNAWADHYFYKIGVNIIDAPTRDKGKPQEQRKGLFPEWKDWQDKPVPDEEHWMRKQEGLYSKQGIAIIPGRVWRGEHVGQWLVFVDCDNSKAIEEFCKIVGVNSLEELSEGYVVEQHKDAPNKAHIYFYSKSPFVDAPGFKGRSTELTSRLEANQIPAFEIKSHGGLAYCCPSFHVNGARYEILGTTIPKVVLNESDAAQMMQKLEGVYKEYGISYLGIENGKALSSSSLTPISDMLKPDYKVKEGNNRHLDVLRIAEHYLLTGPEDAIEKTRIWNREHAVPPLVESELKYQIDCAIKFVEKIKAAEEEKKNSEKDDDEVGAKKENNNSSAKKLGQLVESKTKSFFRDNHFNPLIRIQNDNHYEVMDIKSKKFSYFISKLYYDCNDGAIIKQEPLAEVLRTVTAKALFSPAIKKLHLRTAWEVTSVDENGEEAVDTSTLYYDPCTSIWSYIRISAKEGQWEIIPHHPDNIMFYRYGQLPQVIPRRDHRENIFDEFFDLMHIKSRSDRILLAVMMVASFIPDIPHPILIPHGPQGSAKSTFCRYMKKIVDPVSVELLTVPSKKEEFAQHMHHNLLAAYDNVDKIPGWFSDEVCKATTGGGTSKRELYTDDEDVSYNFKRILLVNGIHNPFTRSDALDRSAMTYFERISDSERAEESVVDAIFQEMRPHLLGKIFDTLVKALQIKLTVKLDKKPRMADFAVWGVAIAKALGGEYEDKFLDAYYEILERQNVDAVEATLIGPALVRWYNNEKPSTDKDNDGMLDQKKSYYYWEGTPETLLRMLTDSAPSFGIDVKSKEWPKKTHTFTRKLRPIIPDLRQAYKLDIIISRDTTGEHTTKNSTWIRIAKIGNNISTGSTSSTDLNLHSAYDADSGGCPNSGRSTNSKACSTTTIVDTKVTCENNNNSRHNVIFSSASGGDVERIREALDKIAPPKDAQIDAQNNKGGASGRNGGNLELPVASSGTTIPLLDGKNYVAFDLESGRINPEDLKIYISLSKDPAEYPANTVQKRVGLYLGAKKGDVIYYYKTNSSSRKEKDASIVPTNPEDIDISEYKKMLFATLKDALEMIDGGDQECIKSDIFSINSSSSECKTSRNLQCDNERVAILEHAKEVIQDKK